MAFNAFANFGEIKGESTDKDHKDWVMILQYHHAVTQPASSSQKTAGGRSAEEVVPILAGARTGERVSSFHKLCGSLRQKFACSSWNRSSYHCPDNSRGVQQSNSIRDVQPRHTSSPPNGRDGNLPTHF